MQFLRHHLNTEHWTHIKQKQEKNTKRQPHEHKNIKTRKVSGQHKGVRSVAHQIRGLASLAAKMKAKAGLADQIPTNSACPRETVQSYGFERTFRDSAVIEFHTDEAQPDPEIRVSIDVSNAPSAFESRAPDTITIISPIGNKLALEGLKTPGKSYETISEIEATLQLTVNAIPTDRPVPEGTDRLIAVVESHNDF